MSSENRSGEFGDDFSGDREETREEMLDRIFHENPVEWSCRSYAAWKRSPHPDDICEHVRVEEDQATGTARMMGKTNFGYGYILGWLHGRTEMARTLNEESESEYREFLESNGREFDPLWPILPSQNIDHPN